MTEIGTLLDAKDIALNPAKYYGLEVSNYYANGITSWQIFHSDEENIYLISSDYAPIYNKLEDESVLEVALKNKRYKRGLNEMLASNPARKWANTSESSAPNDSLYRMLFGLTTEEKVERAVSYMLDTEVWEMFVDKKYAKYAILSPTLKLFVFSYNNVYTNFDDRININDYYNGGRILYSFLHQNLGLYYKASEDYNFMFLSTIGYNGRSVCGAGSHELSGFISVDNRGGGFRPVVCLRPSVKLKINKDNTVSLTLNVAENLF